MPNHRANEIVSLIDFLRKDDWSAWHRLTVSSCSTNNLVETWWNSETAAGGDGLDMEEWKMCARIRSISWMFKHFIWAFSSALMLSMCFRLASFRCHCVFKRNIRLMRTLALITCGKEAKCDVFRSEGSRKRHRPLSLSAASASDAELNYRAKTHDSPLIFGWVFSKGTHFSTRWYRVNLNNLEYRPISVPLGEDTEIKFLFYCGAVKLSGWKEIIWVFHWRSNTRECESDIRPLDSLFSSIWSH